MWQPVPFAPLAWSVARHWPSCPAPGVESDSLRGTPGAGRLPLPGRWVSLLVSPPPWSPGGFFPPRVSAGARYAPGSKVRRPGGVGGPAWSPRCSLVARRVLLELARPGGRGAAAPGPAHKGAARPPRGM